MNMADRKLAKSHKNVFVQPNEAAISVINE